MKRIAIIGGGGFAREVLDIFLACNEVKTTYNVLGFIEEDETSWGNKLNGYPVLGDFEWFAESNRSDEVELVCGVGNPVVRRRLIIKAYEMGLRFCNIIHPTATLTEFVNFGVGVIVTAGCIITNQIEIGNHVHLNLDTTIGHDCRIDDYCTLSPGVHVSGKVHIKEGCDIGTGTTIVQGRTINEWSIIGAGAAVTKDIPANCTAVGVPAKVIKQREPGWQHV